MNLTQTMIDDAVLLISAEQAARIRKAGIDEGGRPSTDALIATGMIVGARELGDRLIKLLKDTDSD